METIVVEWGEYIRVFRKCPIRNGYILISQKLK